MERITEMSENFSFTPKVTNCAVCPFSKWRVAKHWLMHPATGRIYTCTKSNGREIYPEEGQNRIPRWCPMRDNANQE